MLDTILFIHGNSLSSQCFNHQLNNPKLQSMFNIRAIDLPGHGENQKSNSYSLAGLVKYVISTIENDNLKEVNIVGHSLGGHLSIDMMARELSFTIPKLMIFGTPPLKRPVDMTAFQPHPAMASAFNGPLTEDEAASLANALGSMDFKDMILDADPEVRQSIGADLGSGNTLDEVALLKQYKGQLAIAHGEQDPLVSLDYIKELDLDLWQDKVHVIEGAMHSPQYEQPEKFNELLMKFMS